MVKPGRRGPRGLDASRLDVIWSAPFAGEALSAEEYATPGLVVV